jgi:hypothetical protein
MLKRAENIFVAIYGAWVPPTASLRQREAFDREIRVKDNGK